MIVAKDGFVAIPLRRPFATPRPIDPALLILLLIALALRLFAASIPGFHHPDAVFQYIEPAQRLLTGEGVVTWEWRVGSRGWLIPWFDAAPLAFGQWLTPVPGLDLYLVRLLAALLSLASVWAAWTIGARISRPHALLAGLVAATWFEFPYFAAQTLSEPLAVSAALPAAALLTASAPTRRALTLAGLLLGLASLARPQYAPALGVLVLVAQGRAWRMAFPPVLIGGLAALVLGAAADLAAGAAPLAWLLVTVRENIAAGKAASYGTSPVYAYLGWLGVMWRWWLPVVLLGLVPGRRAAPALFWMAVVDLALHSVIAHKEYRFIWLSTATLLLVASLGWAQLLQNRPRLFAGMAVAWIAASAVLATTGLGSDLTQRNRAGSVLFAAFARDPASCGVAVIGPGWSETPGRNALGDSRPLSVMISDDPLLRHGLFSAMRDWDGTFNRAVAPGGVALPAQWTRVRCEPRAHDAPMCGWKRDGGCVDATRSPFLINTALLRSEN